MRESIIKNDQPDEILEFAELYGDLCEPFGRRPILVCVPTTYNLITDAELATHGFNIIIHVIGFTILEYIYIILRKSFNKDIIWILLSLIILL